MKRPLTVGLVLIPLVAGALLLWQRQARDAAPLAAATDTAASSGTTELLGVEQFMQGVDNYQGPVLVEGVVSAVAADEDALTLIDLTELERCGVVTCAPLSLPVRWSGPMPAVVDVVRIRGEVQDSGGKLFFLASTLEKVEPEAVPPQ
jgi:hypothetical protein